jgi:ATP-binding cassette subfamily B protein
VRDADLVLVLREGRIIEQGTHNQLVASSGFYSEMCAAQLLERDLAVS